MNPMIFLVCALWALTTQVQAAAPAPAPNGITLPPYFKEWRLIGISHRLEKNSLRAILGNPVAIDAARSGQTDPWPDGAVLVKPAWQESKMPEWEQAWAPGNLQQVDVMVKDRQKYSATGGWGFARWTGAELKPFGDARTEQECFACHSLAEHDRVFTRPVRLP